MRSFNFYKKKYIKQYLIMYYIYSLIITIILFVIIQLFEKNKHKDEDEEYNYISANNVLIFVMLFLISCVILYFVCDSNSKINIFDFKFKGGSTDKVIEHEINPAILRNINDNINVGFEPYE